METLVRGFSPSASLNVPKRRTPERARILEADLPLLSALRDSPFASGSGAFNANSKLSVGSSKFSFQRKATTVRSRVSKSTETPISHRPVVILPGLGNNTADYKKLVSDLGSKGLNAYVAKVSRPDWLRNASGLLTSDYWKGTLKPLPVLQWYLERVENAVNEAKKNFPGSKVSIIGHSAGGWLARLYLFEKGIEDVQLLVSLGTPHLPPPRGVPGVIDQTRGLLYYIEENIPGAFFSPHVKYVCVAGRYMKGNPLFGNAPKLEVTGLGTLVAESVEPNLSSDSNLDSNSSLSSNLAMPTRGDPLVLSNSGDFNHQAVNRVSIESRIVGQGYKQVCGQAEVWGDGVVPEVSALLEGANNLTLDGVYHSPVGSHDVRRPWYGSGGILDKWVHHLFD